MKFYTYMMMALAISTSGAWAQQLGVMDGAGDIRYIEPSTIEYTKTPVSLKKQQVQQMPDAQNVAEVQNMPVDTARSVSLSAVGDFVSLKLSFVTAQGNRCELSKHVQKEVIFASVDQGEVGEIATFACPDGSVVVLEAGWNEHQLTQTYGGDQDWVVPMGTQKSITAAWIYEEAENGEPVWTARLSQ